MQGIFLKSDAVHAHKDYLQVSPLWRYNRENLLTGNQICTVMFYKQVIAVRNI
jgi:hypothetical protein